MGFSLIKSDNISGASEILIRTANYWLDEIQALQPSSIRRAQTYFRHRGLFIIRLFPNMAPLFHLVNTVLIAIHQSSTIDELKSNAIAAINDSLHRQSDAKNVLVKYASELITSGVTLFTYSRSGVVISILGSLHDMGVPFKLLMTEARPMNEGMVVAEELAQHGIDTTLYVDAAMKQAVLESDLILIGADTFSEETLVNKIGTTAIALLAREAKKPIYCFTTMDKYLPLGVTQPAEPDHDRNQVWPGAPFEIHIRNTYFESTPLALLTDVITESGHFKKNLHHHPPLQVDAWLRSQF